MQGLLGWADSDQPKARARPLDGGAEERQVGLCKPPPTTVRLDQNIVAAHQGSSSKFMCAVGPPLPANKAPVKTTT